MTLLKTRNQIGQCFGLREEWGIACCHGYGLPHRRIRCHLRHVSVAGFRTKNIVFGNSSINGIRQLNRRGKRLHRLTSEVFFCKQNIGGGTVVVKKVGGLSPVQPKRCTGRIKEKASCKIGFAGRCRRQKFGRQHPRSQAACAGRQQGGNDQIITYFTAWVDDAGIQNYRDDIYGHDKELAKRLFTK